MGKKQKIPCRINLQKPIEEYGKISSLPTILKKEFFSDIIAAMDFFHGHARFATLIMSGVIVFSLQCRSQQLCRHVFTKQMEASDSPITRSFDDAERQWLTLEQSLEFFDPQSQRQIIKILSQLRKIKDEFVGNGELSEKKLSQMMKLWKDLEVFEAKIQDIHISQRLEPDDLRRFLFSPDRIEANKVYFADIPGLGVSRIHFFKEVASVMNQNFPFRQSRLPLIFKGLVGKLNQSGIKQLRISKPPVRNGVEFYLYELKKVGSGDRIIAVGSNAGDFYLYRHIKNHNRSQWANKENFIGTFLPEIGL